MDHPIQVKRLNSNRKQRKLQIKNIIVSEVIENSKESEKPRKYLQDLSGIWKHIWFWDHIEAVFNSEAVLFSNIFVFLNWIYAYFGDYTIRYFCLDMICSQLSGALEIPWQKT